MWKKALLIIQEARQWEKKSQRNWFFLPDEQFLSNLSGSSSVRRNYWSQQNWEFWHNWSEKELNLVLRSWVKHTCTSKCPGNLCEALKDRKLSKSVPEFHCLSYVKMLYLMKINQDNFPSVGTITLCTCAESFMQNGWFYYSASYLRLQIRFKCMRCLKIIKTNEEIKMQIGRNQWTQRIYTGESFWHTQCFSSSLLFMLNSF